MDICNPTTKLWIDAFIRRPKTTLLIHSSNDSRTGVEVAEYIYGQLNESPKTPLFRVEKGDAKSLGIDEVRELHKYLTLRADSNAEHSRFVLINEAELLTVEAQNSLLKLLEELPNKTILILVTEDVSRLLPTINSRCFHINVLPITLSQAIEYGVSHQLDRVAVEKAFAVSEGNALVFKEIIENEENLTTELIKLAKQFISSTVIERQDTLKRVYKNETSITELLRALKLIARSGMRNAHNAETKYRWKGVLLHIMNTEKQIESNVQTKLAMLALSVSI